MTTVTKTPSYRVFQTRRGKEALKMFVDFLETHFGPLQGLSVNEANYSTGSWSRPDVVFRQFGIEVKRVELMAKARIPDKDFYYAHLNNLSINHKSWDRMKTWCRQNQKKPVLVVVLTCGFQEPMFIRFNQFQVNALQQAQRSKKWFQLNAWGVLREGIILTPWNIHRDFEDVDP